MHYSIMPDSVFWVGKAGPRQVAKGHPRFQTITDKLLDGEDPTDLADVATAVRSLDGRISVEGGRVTLDGKPLEDEVLEAHVVAIAEAGEDVQPFFRFIQSLDRNPSRRAREQLFRFLAANGLTLLEDGRVLAYKGVLDSYKDVHTGTFDNRPGNIHSMPRRNVDDDPNRTCSYGFHVGALSYARWWGQRVVATAFAAEDAVSVPTDEQDRKLRTCAYEVLRDWEGPDPAGVPVYRQDDDTLGEYAVTIRGWDGHRDLEKTYRVRAHDEDDAELEAKDEAAGDEDFDSGDRDDFEVVSLEIAGAKRFSVVLRAAEGLSGYVYRTFQVEAETPEEAQSEAFDRWNDSDLVDLEGFVESITEL